MNLDYAAMRDKWIKEKPLYERFARYIEDSVSQHIRIKGFWARTSYRAKDLDSFLKKIFRKRYDDPFRQMIDLAGVRITVKFLEHLYEVKTIVETHYEVLKYEDKSQSLDFNEFGYSGIHMEVQLRSTSLDMSTQDFAHMICEIQIRTLSQDVWAEIEHDFSYKPDFSVPLDIRRTLCRMSALLEISDNEFSAVQQKMLTLPDASEYGILSALEKPFFRFVGWQYDKELSLEIIRSLKSLYEDTSLIELSIESFADKNSDKIEAIYQQYKSESEHPLLLYQPEIFLIFERLEAKEFQLIYIWQEYYPFEGLQDIAKVWGRPLE